MVKEKHFHRTVKCVNSIDKDLNPLVMIDLKKFSELLTEQVLVASKKTHYHRLDEWSDVVYGFVHKMLRVCKFKNGKKEQNINAAFWWSIYGLVSGVIHSPELPLSDVARHHTSAYDRNHALLGEVNHIISEFNSIK